MGHFQVAYLLTEFMKKSAVSGYEILVISHSPQGKCIAQRFDHLHLVCSEPESQNVKSSLTGKKTEKKSCLRINQTPKTSIRY